MGGIRLISADISITEVLYDGPKRPGHHRRSSGGAARVCKEETEVKAH